MTRSRLAVRLLRLVARTRRLKFAWFHCTSPAHPDNIRHYFPQYARRAWFDPPVPRNAAGRRRINRMLGTDRWLWSEWNEIHYEQSAAEWAEVQRKRGVPVAS